MKTTMNGELLANIEQDLLRIGRELAETQAVLNAAKLIAGAPRTDEDDEWFSLAEHYAPLVAASEKLTAARAGILQAVREVQGTNPIPARRCTGFQHETDNDEGCSICHGTGYVVGIAPEFTGMPRPRAQRLADDAMDQLIRDRRI